MISETKEEVLKLFAEGRLLYEKRDFAKAKDKFSSALALDPNDGPSAVFKLRCKLYITNPPDDDWDGVFEMKTK